MDGNADVEVAVQAFEELPERVSSRRASASRTTWQDWDILDLDISRKTLTRNNLGGRDNPGAPHEIRYSKVMEVMGHSVDLVVTVLTDYKPGKYHATGAKSRFGLINIEGQTNATMKFTIVKEGTTTPVKVHKLWFSVFDVDGGFRDQGFKEYFLVAGYVAEYRSVETQVERSYTQGGATLFKSTATDSSGGYGNPLHPTEALTKEQRDRIVQLLFMDVSEFYINFGAGGGEQRLTMSRTIMFAGKSGLLFDTSGNFLASAMAPYNRHEVPKTTETLEQMECDLPPWHKLDMHLDSKSIVWNNLGGKGSGGPPEIMRFSGVMNAMGTPVDLVVSATSSYHPGVYSGGTGTKGPFGSISIEDGTSVGLRFQIVRSGTNEEKRLPWFWFSFFDIDGLPTTTDCLEISGYFAEFRTEFTLIDKTDEKKSSDGSSSAKFCASKDTTETLEVPKHTIGGLDILQAHRVVSFVFKDRSEFTATLSASGVGIPTQFFFAGKSGVVFDDSGCMHSNAVREVLLS